MKLKKIYKKGSDFFDDFKKANKNRIKFISLFSAFLKEFKIYIETRERLNDAIENSLPFVASARAEKTYKQYENVITDFNKVAERLDSIDLSETFDDFFHLLDKQMQEEYEYLGSLILIC